MTDQESMRSAIIHRMKEEEWYYITNHLSQYNAEESEGFSRKPGIPINLTLKDDQQVIGGLMGRTIYLSFIIDHLWIDKTYRGKGHGTRLVREGERLAKEEGCISSQTSTYSFQAPEFYKKLDYDIFGVFAGYPDGIKKFYLGKDL